MGAPEREARRQSAESSGEWLLGRVFGKADGVKQKDNAWVGAYLHDLLQPGKVPVKDGAAKDKRKGDQVIKGASLDRDEVWNNFAAWSREKEVVQKWTSRWFAERARYPSLAEEATFIQDKRLANYPYNEAAVNYLVNDITSGGKRHGGHLVDQKNGCYDTAGNLREICQRLVAMGNDRAKKMVEPMKACMLADGISPATRHIIMDGLEELVRGGAMSKEDFALTVAKGLQQDLQRAPQIKPGNSLSELDYKDAESSLLRMVRLLGKFQTPKVKEMLQQIADDDKCPVPTVRKQVQALLLELK
jgi:hypothetical protein